jgi:hypothetical protein
MSGRLTEIGRPLGVEKSDIERISRHSLWDRIKYPLIMVAIVVLSAIAGFIIGDRIVPSRYDWSTYPFIPISMALTSLGSKKTFIALTAIGSILLFSIAMLVGMKDDQMYGVGVEYGSYYR